jgi:hypothetical protein
VDEDEGEVAKGRTEVGILHLPLHLLLLHLLLRLLE